jgi:hypothetical protein
LDPNLKVHLEKRLIPPHGSNTVALASHQSGAMLYNKELYGNNGQIPFIESSGVKMAVLEPGQQFPSSCASLISMRGSPPAAQLRILAFQTAIWRGGGLLGSLKSTGLRSGSFKK